MKHLPVITTDTAACTCGNWEGLTRQPHASIGLFTLNAYEAHGAHVSTVNRHPKHDGQASMFGQVDLFEANQ